MRRRMKCMISAVIFAVCMITGTACGKKATEETAFSPKMDSASDASVTVYGSYSNFEALESEFERFHEYYPKVNLSYVYLDGYNDAIGNSLLSSEAPDIYCTFYWMWGNPDCAEIFASAADLSDSDAGIDLSCVREGIVRKTDKGEVLMAPVLSTSFGMLVNTDLFKKEKMEVPTTWGEFLEVCDTFKKAGYTSPVMGYISDEPGSLEYNFAYPSLCREAVTDPSMRDRFNDLDAESGELMRPGLEKLKALADAGYIDVEKCTKEIENNYDAAIMRFFEGDVPMLICSGDVVSGTKKRESQSESFSAAPFAYRFYPVPLDEEGSYVIDTVSMNFSVNKNSPNKDMAMEFMRFLISDEELGNMASVKGLITTARDFSPDSVYAALSETPQDRMICSTEANINDQAIKQFRSAAHQVLVGEMTVDDAIASYGKD